SAARSTSCSYNTRKSARRCSNTRSPRSKMNCCRISPLNEPADDGQVLAGTAPRIPSTTTRSDMSEAGCAIGIIMGSQSDWETMQHVAHTLDRLGISYEKRIVSAHRTPERLYKYAKGAQGRGLK